ncbi:MAG TPA: enoyl-ACP reductase [Thermomicrobiales bacterium]|nr:enoyl-ACP reductase [Thermomicrobiales bacterium]
MGLMDGKKVLVMGVANHRSLAWGISDALHREGAELAFSHLPDDRMRRNLDKLVAGWDSAADILMVPCNVQEDGQVEALFQAVGERWGKLDVFVHSISFANREEITGRYSQISRDGFLLAQDVNTYSLIECSRYAEPLMEAAGGGSIITMTYLAAERVVPNYNVMSAAKASLESSVRYLAADLGPQNIRVNAISSGPMRTLAASAVGAISTARELMEERAPLRRNITLEEVGNVGLFLASDLSSGVTGQVIYADCGFNITAM